MPTLRDTGWDPVMLFFFLRIYIIKYIIDDEKTIIKHKSKFDYIFTQKKNTILIKKTQESDWH